MVLLLKGFVVKWFCRLNGFAAKWFCRLNGLAKAHLSLGLFDCIFPFLHNSLLFVHSLHMIMHPYIQNTTVATSGTRANCLIRLDPISIDIVNPIPKHCKTLREAALFLIWLQYRQ